MKELQIKKDGPIPEKILSNYKIFFGEQTSFIHLSKKSQHNSGDSIRSIARHYKNIEF